MWLSMKLMLILNFSISSVLSADTCYWPNGADATGDMLPCSSLDSNLKQCCARNEACLSNGMCFSAGNGGLYRGACTDQSWTTIGCPQHCNTIWTDGNAITTQCPHNGTTTVGDASTRFQSWCGSDSTTICLDTTQGELFTVAFGNVSGIVGKALASTSSSTTAASAPSKTNSAAASTSTCESAGTKTATTVIGVGVGVGIPLALLATALGTLFVMERKKRIAAELGHASAGHAGYNGLNETHEAGTGYTQDYKDELTELNAHEVHELGHSSRKP